MKERPLLLIEWEDSYNGDHAWQALSDVPKKIAPVKIGTVGYLVRRGKKRITLAMSLTNQADPQLCDLFTIPVGCIISERKLK